MTTVYSDIFYGTSATPNGVDYYRVAVQWRAEQISATTYTKSHRYWFEVTTGDFEGTNMSVSWQSARVTCYGVGTYGDTNWVTDGTANYGEAVTDSQKAYYTTWGGNYIESAVTPSWTPTSPTTAPYAPQLLTPSQGLVFNKDEQSAVSFSWQFNPAEAGSQVQASTELSMVSNTGATLSQTWNGAGTTHSLAKTDLPNGSVMTWKLRNTDGDNETGAWSNERQFRVITNPSVTITSPTAFNSLPLEVQFTYSDDQSTQRSAVVKLEHGGQVISTKDTGALSWCDFLPADFMVENGTAYTITVEVTNQLGIVTTASTTVTASFTTGTLVASATQNNGYITITAPSGASVYRGNEYIGQSTGTLVDTMVPLNTNYTYTIQQFVSGVLNSATVTGNYGTNNCFFIFDGGTASAQFNPTLSRTITKPNRELRNYAGRRYPVAYADINTKEALTAGFVLTTSAEIDAFKELAKIGQAIYKNPDGEVFCVACSVDIVQDVQSVSVLAEVTVQMTRTALRTVEVQTAVTLPPASGVSF